MYDMASTPSAEKTMPASTTRRAPIRSVAVPITGAITPPTSERREKASEVDATDHPNSLMTSEKIVPNP